MVAHRIFSLREEHFRTYARFLHLVFFLIFGVVAYWLALVAWTVWRLTHPPRRTFGVALAQGRPTDPSKLISSSGVPREFESWSIRVDGCELPVWDIHGDAAHGPILVLTHGWGDSRLGGLSRAHALLPVVSRCVLWDMPGHGDAEGTSALGMKEVAALRVLIERIIERNGPDAKIVLFGWSLGAGVSLAAGVWMASHLREKLLGVVAESPYRVPWTPARAVFSMQGLPTRGSLVPALWVIGLMNRAGLNFASGRGPAASDVELAREIGEFDRASISKKLAAKGVPVLVLHGTDDTTCPIADGEAIATSAKGKFVAIDGAGHFGLWTDPRFAEQSASAVREWMLTGV